MLFRLYDVQTRELEEIEEENKETFLPFIFADPQRVENKDDEFNNEPNFFEYLKKKILDKTFAGIKLYPALGYWPFDQRLEEVYDFALENNIPIMVHCAVGPFYNRGKKKFENHPIDNSIVLEGKKPKEFTQHYTNPINYNMLMDSDIISKHWMKDKDYRNLKICLGHFGGDKEWLRYLKSPWIAGQGNILETDIKPSLRRENWNFSIEPKPGQFTWFSVICELLEKYDNLYADISSSAENEEIFPMVKLLLSKNSKIRDKILFGTDYYMVAKDN